MAGDVNIGSVYGTLELRTDKFNSALSEAQSKLQSFGNSASSGTEKAGNSISTSLASVGKSFGLLSAGLAIPSAAIVSFGKKMIGLGMDFEEAMAKVAAVAGVKASETDASFKKLHDTAIQLGIDTRFTSTQAAEGLYELASAGMDVEKSIKTLPKVLDLATASQMSLGDTALTIVNLMQAFSRTNLDAAHASDVLAKGVNTSTLHFQDLQEALPFVAGSFGQLGLKIEDAVTSLAILSDAGVRGGRAGEYLRQMINALIDPSSQAKDKMIELGIATEDGGNILFDASGKMKSMGEILSIFTEKTSGLTEQERLEALGKIFQVQGAQAMNTLIQKGTGLFDEYNSSLVDSEGAAKDMADTMNNTLAFSIDQLNSTVETLGIKLNEILRPAFKPIIDGITQFVNKITEFIAKNPQVAQVVALVLAAIVGITAVAGAIAGIAFIIGAIGEFLLPVTYIIGGLVAVFMLLKNHMDWVTAAWNFMKPAVDLVVQAFQTYWTFIQTQVIPILQQLWQYIQNNILPIFVQVWDFVLNMLAPVWELLKTQLVELWNKFMDLWNVISPYVLPVLKVLAIIIAGVLVGAFLFVGAVIAGVITIISGIVWVVGQVIDAVKRFIQEWRDRFNEAKSIVSEAVGRIKDFIGDLFNFSGGAREWGKRLVQDFIDGIWSMISRVGEAAAGIANKVKAFLKVGSPTDEGPWRTIDKWMPNLTDMWVGQIKGSYGEFANAFSGLASQVSGFSPTGFAGYNAGTSGVPTNVGNEKGLRNLNNQFQFFGPVTMTDEKSIDQLANKVNEKLLADVYPARSGGI